MWINGENQSVLSHCHIITLKKALRIRYYGTEIIFLRRLFIFKCPTMKRTLFLVVMLFLASGISSCTRDDADFETSFEKSQKAWLSFKAASGDSYSYLVKGSSSETGASWQTTITVTNGMITGREFRFTSHGSEQVSAIHQQWKEGEGQINTISCPYAAEAMTMDQVYERARQQWLVKRQDVTLLLETRHNGMISRCGFMENDCIDNCFTGIHIGFIESGSCHGQFNR